MRGSGFLDALSQKKFIGNPVICAHVSWSIYYQTPCNHINYHATAGYGKQFDYIIIV